MKTDVLRVRKLLCKFCLQEFEPTHNNVGTQVYCQQCKSSARNRRRTCAKFGLTLDDMRRMLERQGGVCAICRVVQLDLLCGSKGTKRTCLDHDHQLGHARGFLCCKCNNLLAAIEIPGFVERARLYLRDHGSFVPRTGKEDIDS